MSLLNRKTLRQKLVRRLSAGVTGTNTGTSASAITDTSRLEPDDYWKDGQVYISGGAQEGGSGIVQTSYRATGVANFLPALSSALASGATYELHHRDGWLVEEHNDAIQAAVERGAVKTLVDLVDEGTTLASTTSEYDLPVKKIVTGVADSGTTTTLVDAQLTEDDDFWIGATLIITADTGTAANVGEVRILSDSDESDTKLTWKQALPGAVTTGTTYRLIKYPFAYVSQVFYLDSGNWLPIGENEQDRESWKPMPGLYPRVRLLEGHRAVSAQARIVGQRFAGDLNVDADLVELPEAFVLSYAEWYLRSMRARRVQGDPFDDVARARLALEEATIHLEGISTLIVAGSKRAR